MFLFSSKMDNFGWVVHRYSFLREMSDYLSHLFQFGYTFDLMGSDRIYLKLFSFLSNWICFVCST